MVSFLGDSYVGPNPLGSIARQFHAQAWQRYAMPLVLTCGQNKCRGDTEPTQSAEYSRTGQQLIYRVRIPQETIHWGTLRKEGAPRRLLYLRLISFRKRCNPCGYAVFSLLRSVRCCWKASSISSGVSSWRMPTPL